MASGIPPADFHQMMVNGGLYANQGKVTCGNIECDLSVGEYCHQGLGECRPCSDTCGPQHELKPSPNCQSNCHDWLIEQAYEKLYQEIQIQTTGAASKPPTTTPSSDDNWTSLLCPTIGVITALAVTAVVILAVLLAKKRICKRGKQTVDTRDIEMTDVEFNGAENEANHHGDEDMTTASQRLIHSQDDAVDSSGYNSSRTPSPPDTPGDLTTRHSTSFLNSSHHQVDQPGSSTGCPHSRPGGSNMSTPIQVRQHTPALASQSGHPARDSGARSDRNHQSFNRFNQGASDSAIDSSNSLDLDFESTRDVAGTGQTTALPPARVHQPDSAQVDSERMQQPSYCPPYPETANIPPV